MWFLPGLCCDIQLLAEPCSHCSSLLRSASQWIVLLASICAVWVVFTEASAAVRVRHLQFTDLLSRRAHKHSHRLSLLNISPLASFFFLFWAQLETLFTDCSWTSGCVRERRAEHINRKPFVGFYSLYQLLSSAECWCALCLCTLWLVGHRGVHVDIIGKQPILQTQHSLPIYMLQRLTSLKSFVNVELLWTV